MVDIRTDTDKPLWIYGFPTTGKSWLQRTLRFLNAEQRAYYRIPSVIDATDTDDWFGCFKKSDNPREERLDELLVQSCRLTQTLKSHHPRVIVTNLHRVLADVGITPLAIFVPADPRSVADRVRERGDANPDWITSHVDQWLEHLCTSTWYKQHSARVIRLQPGEHVADYISINGRKLIHHFDRDGAVISIE